MEQVNPFRLNGVYKGVTGSLVGQVPYGYETVIVFVTQERLLWRSSRQSHYDAYFV